MIEWFLWVYEKNCFPFAKPIKGNWRLIILCVIKIGLFSLMEDTSPLRCYSLLLGKEKEVECLQTGPTFAGSSEKMKIWCLAQKAEKVPMNCNAKKILKYKSFLSSLSQLILVFLICYLNALHRDIFRVRAAAHMRLGALFHDCEHSSSTSCQGHLSPAARPACCALVRGRKSTSLGMAHHPNP